MEASVAIEGLSDVLAQLDYEHDARRLPDELRRRQFHVGWRDAVQRDETYTGRTLRGLTWRNLGYRLGRHFGDLTPREIDQNF